MNAFNNFSPTSKVWIYQAKRNLTEQEVANANEAADKFTAQWAAHNQALNAKGKILENRFLVLMVDEAQAQASGCSIDSSVHFVQELGNQLQIDFFDRLNIAYPIDGTIKTFPLKDLKSLFLEGKFDDTLYIYNNTVTNKKDFDEKWLVPIKESWLGPRIPTAV